VQLFHKGHRRHALHRNHTRMMAMLKTRICPIVYSYTEIRQGIFMGEVPANLKKVRAKLRITFSNNNETQSELVSLDTYLTRQSVRRAISLSF
jgi:hypothetical protein